MEESETSTPPLDKAGNWQNHIFFFWFSIAAGSVTLVGLPLSVYFYQASQIRPLLTFGVYPLKTELQRPDHDTGLGFIYEGKPVASESITSVQVAIFNAGTRTIRDSDVLAPFRLVMPDGSAILSVRVKTASRPICGVECLDNEDDYKLGACRLKWRILEPDDGAVLQIIYAGSARHDPTLEGAVEGQRDGIVVERYDLTPDKRRISPSGISSRRLGAALLLTLLAVLLIAVAFRARAGTEAAKKLAAETAQAVKHLVEIRRRTAPPPPIFWILIAIALTLPSTGPQSATDRCHFAFRFYLCLEPTNAPYLPSRRLDRGRRCDCRLCWPRVPAKVHGPCLRASSSAAPHREGAGG